MPEPWKAKYTLKELNKKYPVTTQELLAELNLSSGSDPDSETDEEDSDHNQELFNRLF